MLPFVSTCHPSVAIMHLSRQIASRILAYFGPGWLRNKQAEKTDHKIVIFSARIAQSVQPADSLRAVPEPTPGGPGCTFPAVAPSGAMPVCTGRSAACQEKAKPDTDFPDGHGGRRWLSVCSVYFVVAPLEWAGWGAVRYEVRHSLHEPLRRPRRRVGILGNEITWLRPGPFRAAGDA
jgi:hypothetical protein